MSKDERGTSDDEGKDPLLDVVIEAVGTFALAIVETFL